MVQLPLLTSLSFWCWQVSQDTQTQYFRILYRIHKVVGILPFINACIANLSSSFLPLAITVPLSPHIWIIIPAPSLAPVIPGQLGSRADHPAVILDTDAKCIFLQCCFDDIILQHPTLLSRLERIILYITLESFFVTVSIPVAFKHPNLCVGHV